MQPRCARQAVQPLVPILVGALAVARRRRGHSQSCASALEHGPSLWTQTPAVSGSWGVMGAHPNQACIDLFAQAQCRLCPPQGWPCHRDPVVYDRLKVAGTTNSAFTPTADCQCVEVQSSCPPCLDLTIPTPSCLYALRRESSALWQSVGYASVRVDSQDSSLTSRIN